MILARIKPFEFPRVGDFVFTGLHDRRFERVGRMILDVDPARVPLAYATELEGGEQTWVARAPSLDETLLAAGATRRGARVASGLLERLGQAITDEAPQPRAYVRLIDR